MVAYVNCKQLLAIDNKKRKLTGGEESKKGKKLTKINNLALEIIENLKNDFEKKEINTEKQIINIDIKIDEINFKDESNRLALVRIHIPITLQDANTGECKI